MLLICSYVIMFPSFYHVHTCLFCRFGDGCDRKWGDPLLAVYVVLYVVIFIWFGWSLRQVVDGFKIKVGSVVVIALVEPARL